MIINIEKLVIQGKEELDLEEKIELNSKEFEGLIFLKPVEAFYNLKIYQEGVFLEGSYKAIVKIDCVRCLEKFEKEFEGEFSREFVSKEEYDEYLLETADRHNYNPELYEKDFLENNLIDTSKVLQEVLVLDIPQYPICKEECKGLEELAEYQNDDIDPRWQELLNITKEK